MGVCMTLGFFIVFLDESEDFEGFLKGCRDFYRFFAEMVCFLLDFYEFMLKIYKPYYQNKLRNPSIT